MEAKAEAAIDTGIEYGSGNKIWKRELNLSLVQNEKVSRDANGDVFLERIMEQKSKRRR